MPLALMQASGLCFRRFDMMSLTPLRPPVRPRQMRLSKRRNNGSQSWHRAKKKQNKNNPRSRVAASCSFRLTSARWWHAMHTHRNPRTANRRDDSKEQKSNLLENIPDPLKVQAATGGRRQTRRKEKREEKKASELVFRRFPRPHLSPSGPWIDRRTKSPIYCTRIALGKKQKRASR